ncbi:MAG: DUF3127 domain-containing protein [Bacteroidales bacterium]|nr:DUF3127 domain-containing protein [Bacteroidales bacterium]MBD5284479.1 DUF3127 domain-containing protein [Bacteroides sp.]
MATEIEGKIIQELPMQSGVSKAGREWKKREWVLETFGNYPRKVKFHIFGDRADQFNIVVGNNYRLQVDIESREFNGRWYTDVSAYNVVPADAAPAPQYQQAAPQYGAAPAPAAPAGFGAPAPAADPFAPTGAPTDDLPF